MLNTVFLLEIYEKEKLIVTLEFPTYERAEKQRKKVPKKYQTILIISESEEIVE